MAIQISGNDVEQFVQKSNIKAQENYTNYSEGDIVSYNGKCYILKLSKNATEKNKVYNLYNFDGTLFKEDVPIKDIKFYMNKETYDKYYSSIVQLKTESESSSSSSSGGYSGGGGGGGYVPSRTGKKYTTTDTTDIKKATQNSEEAKDISEKLGTQDRTRKTVQECQNTISKAQEAIDSANITVSKWEDTKNTQGYATQAAIVYLNNITKALDTLQSNLDKTQLSALEVDALNTSVKNLLVDFAEKEEKEEQVKAKETALSSMSPTISSTDKDGKTTQTENKEYTKLKNEIDELNKEIAEIDKDIADLQEDIDGRYKRIQEKYGGLLNFSNSNVSVTGSNIFGTSGDSSKFSYDADGEVIKNYMVANNLEYFEFDNCIYNLASPYDPWNNTKIELDEPYLIKYDLAKLTSYANNGNEIAAGAIDFIKGKANGTISDSVRHYIGSSEAGRIIYENGSYSKIGTQCNDQIDEVMNAILKDTYEANNCKTVSEYAATSMMVMSGGVFSPVYNLGAKPTESGINGIDTYADCISAVNWAMSQGIYNAEGDKNLEPLGLGYGLRPKCYQYNGSDELEVGTVVTKEIPHNWHTAMVVGHTTVNGKKYNVVVHTGNQKYGFNAHIVEENSYDGEINAEDLKQYYYA